MPPDASKRSRLIGKFGNLEVYLFDLYSIALSKIARGFETDLEDVTFMLRKDLVDLVELDNLFQIVLPLASKSDIDPKEFQAYFSEVKRRMKE